VTVHQLSRRDARRVAIRAQLLDMPRPTSLHAVTRHLSLLQIDATATIAPSVYLVLWSRLGSSHSPTELDDALDDGSLVELQGMIRPSDDLRLYRADMADWPGRSDVRGWRQSQSEWVSANDECRLDILDRLEVAGPLPARDLPDTCSMPWRSSGWNNNRNVALMLELMADRGEVAVAARNGRERLWDLSSRVYPDGPAVPAEEALRLRNQRRLSYLGIARAKGPECAVEPYDVGEVGEPAVIDGVRGTWRVDPAALDEAFTGRTALLSPFDRLIFDRKRAVDIFGFEYGVEIYKPAAKRKWGYYALPILHGDQLVGKLDATADRNAGVLRVDAIHQDVDFSTAMTTAVHGEIEDLAEWLDLEVNFAI